MRGRQQGLGSAKVNEGRKDERSVEIQKGFGRAGLKPGAISFLAFDLAHERASYAEWKNFLVSLTPGVPGLIAAAWQFGATRVLPSQIPPMFACQCKNVWGAR